MLILLTEKYFSINTSLTDPNSKQQSAFQLFLHLGSVPESTALKQQYSDQAQYLAGLASTVCAETKQGPNKHQPSFPASASSCVSKPVCPHIGGFGTSDSEPILDWGQSRGCEKESHWLASDGFFGSVICPVCFGSNDSRFEAKTGSRAFRSSVDFVAVGAAFSWKCRGDWLSLTCWGRFASGC